MADEAPKHPGGRPTVFDPKIAQEILDKISDGASLSSICRDEKYPCRATVRLWVRKGDSGDEEYAEFSANYASARREQAHSLVDDVIDIADDDSEDGVMVRGVRRLNKEFVARSKVKIETRMRLAAIQHPELYAERRSVALTDPKGNALPPPPGGPMVALDAAGVAEIIKGLRDEF